MLESISLAGEFDLQRVSKGTAPPSKKAKGTFSRKARGIEREGPMGDASYDSPRRRSRGEEEDLRRKASSLGRGICAFHQTR